MKLVVIGNAGAGKTSLIRRYTEGVFSTNYKATVGVDFAIKNGVQIWDVAGQERFGAVTSTYYRGANGALVVFDWSNQECLENAFKWIDDLAKKLNDPIPIYVVANKSDLPGMVSLEDVESKCNIEERIIGWSATSAKNGTGIDAAMNTLLKHLKVEEGEKEDIIKLDLKNKSSCCL